MINFREGTFETNSSSTHTLVIGGYVSENYIPISKHIKIEWIDTDDYYVLESFGDKISYLISHIARALKYSCNTYEELLEEIEDNYEFKKIAEYVRNTYDKEIRFPNNKNGIYDDVELIAEINHQLIPWGNSAIVEDVLDELIKYREDKNGNRLAKEENTDEDMSFEEKLKIYLENGNFVSFGRD